MRTLQNLKSELKRVNTIEAKLLLHPYKKWMDNYQFKTTFCNYNFLYYEIEKNIKKLVIENRFSGGEVTFAYMIENTMLLDKRFLPFVKGVGTGDYFPKIYTSERPDFLKEITLQEALEIVKENAELLDSSVFGNAMAESFTWH